MIAYIKDGVPTHWKGEPVNGVYHSLNIEDYWSTAQLNAAGFYRVEYHSIPPGHTVTGEATYVLKGNTVVQTYPTTPPPKPSLWKRLFK